MSQEKRIYVGMHDGVCAVTSADGGKTWQQGPVTQLAHAAARLTSSPVAPRRAYLAAYEAGVYRTDDGGLTWRHLDSYPTDYAHSVLAHPSEDDTVYVGSEPAAVFRSPDGGQTWEEFGGFRAVPESTEWGFHAPTRDSHVRDLRIAPDNPDCIYAGIEVGGMVSSGDGGASWTQLPGLDDDIHCVNLSGDRPGSVYVATASAPYRSDDGGAQWELINTGLDRRYTLHIAAAPDDADLILVTVSSNARRSNPQFYRSVDGGRSWMLVDGLGAGENPEDMVVAFEWDPQEPGKVYAGTDGGGLFRSEDRGLTWQALPVSLTTVAVGALAVSSD
jgi:photosystem II stability/assembly factor-like uncharacterized protein